MENYISYTILSTDEALIGLLSAFPFEAFEEHETHMIAYISKKNMTKDIQTQVHALLEQREVDFIADIIEPRNWNEEWESNFSPVIVKDFCSVRADFHPANSNVKHDIIINPKMAFGTGHHETTFMMIAAMEKIDFVNKKVLDYGCGTGILAILAGMLGAEMIDANDIEQESYKNTQENCKINNITTINPIFGDINEVKNGPYDIILANINRNVLITTSDILETYLAHDGILIISGILKEDKNIVLSKYRISGFLDEVIMKKGNWLCITFKKDI